jgi:lysylphosphatidylglycerol synthetase-like protein (DUF2156 family)
MPTSRFERFLPLAGVLTGLLFLAAFFLSGPEPGVGDPAKQLTWLKDHQGAANLGGFAAAYSVVTLLFFAAGIRQILRSGESGESTYSSAAFAGGLLLATATAVSAVSVLAAAEAANKDNAAVVQTIGYLADYSWIPWIAGAAVLFLATGLGGLRTARLPKWLSILTVVLGVLCLLGPAGIAVYFVSPLWLIATGLIMSRRASTRPPATAQVPAPALV